MANQESRLAIVIDSKQAEQNIKRLRTALKNVGKESIDAGAGLELLSEVLSPLKQLDSLFGKAAKSAKDLSKSAKDTTKSVTDLAKESKANADITKDLGDKAKVTSNEVDKLGDKSGKAKKGVKELGDKADETGSRLERMKKSINGFNDGVSGLRNAALVGMGALTGVLYKSIGTAQKFETAMAEVNKTVDFESPQGLEDMRKGLEDLSTQIPQTFEELAATASNAGLLGVAEKDILGFTETVAKMGVAFDIQSDAVAESMAKIANVFKIPIKDIGELGDVINHLSNNMASTAGEIIDFTKRTASMADTVGLSENATAAFGSAMVALGMPAEVAGTAFNAFLGKLSNLDGLSKRGKAAFNSMGLDANKFATLMQTDAQAAILLFIETLRDLPKEMQAATAYDVLGAELAPKVLAMAAGYDEVTRAINMTADAAGSMEKEFAAISDTSANKMVLFKNNIDLVFAAVGDAFIPALNDALAAVKPFLESMADWAKENPELMTQIVAVAGALTGAVLAISGIGLVISGVISAFSGLVVIGGAVATAIGAISLPVVAVVAAIAALVAGGVALYKNWDTVKAKASEVWSGIKESVSGVIEGVKAKFTEFTNAASNIWSGIKEKALEVFNGLPEPVHGAVDRIKELFGFLSDAVDVVVETWGVLKDKAGEVWGSVKDTVSNKVGEAVESMKVGFDKAKPFIEAGLKLASAYVQTWFSLLKGIFTTELQIIKGVFKTGFAVFKTIASTGLSVVATVFNTKFDLIKNIIKTVFNVIKALIQGDMRGVVDAFKKGMSNAWDIIKDGASNIVNTIKELGSKLFNAGAEAVQGLINGLKSRISAVTSAGSGLAKAAIGAIRGIAGFDSHSPSRKTTKAGEEAGQGLANGMKKKTKAVKTEAQKLAEQAISSIKDTISNLKRDIALFGNDDPIAAMLWDRANTDKYKGVGDGLFNQAVDLTKQKASLELMGKFKDTVKGIDDAIRNSSVVTELQKWFNSLSDAGNELSKLKLEDKTKLLEKAADLDYSNLSKEMAKSSKEIDRQVEMLGVKSSLDKELLSINYKANDLLEKYSFYLEQGQTARYKELQSLILSNAEREKSLAILKEEQRIKDELSNGLSSVRNDLFSYAGGSNSYLNNDFTLEDTLETLRQSMKLGLVTQKTYEKLAETAKQKHYDTMRELNEQYVSDTLGSMSSMFKGMFGEQSKAYRIMFAIEKGFAIAKSIMAIQTAMASATASLPFPANLPVIAQVAAQGAQIIGNIRSVVAPVGQAHDGIMSVPKSGTWNLEKGERVLPQHTAKALDKKLDKDGSKVIINNYTNEKAEAKQTPDGDIIVTIGKMIDAKIEQRFIKSRRQGWSNYGR